MTSSDNQCFYKHHPKTCARDDFWGQVKRTVNGLPISEDQIGMIVDAVCDGLALNEEDRLLDLCCGNGALTDRLFARCAGGLGVDYSEYLIDVAQEYFSRPPERIYRLNDAVAYLRMESDPAAFTKAACYGSFQYLAPDQAHEFLATLRRRFTGIRRLFIGNIPDKQRIANFYTQNNYSPGIENDHTSPIGIWRSCDEFERLAGECGWLARFSRMPKEYYAAHYRYDAILTPGG